MALYNQSLRPFKKVVPTNDNTFTLYSAEFDECYHSTNDGALNESLGKHIMPAFSLMDKRDRINILDICFGLGYNTFATIHYCKTNNIKTKIEILSPELDLELVQSLKYFEYPKEFDNMKNIINSISDNLYYEDEQFKISVLIGDAREILQKCTKKFDIIYQDAFSPKKNPLLWTNEYFANLRTLSNDDIILTTYSIASNIRLAMSENGFKIYDFISQSPRRSTIASFKKLDLPYVDMKLKKERNKNLVSLKDKDYLK